MNQNQDCKGCGNKGKHLFSKDGFCKCPMGREMKEQHDVKVDQYFDSLGKKEREEDQPAGQPSCID